MRDHGGGWIRVGIPPKGNLYKTGQLTCYVIGDDGDRQTGIAKRYQINTTGQYAGTVNVDEPEYAAATIAFAATTPGTITDTANLLATFLTGDTIRIRGSGLNDGIYTISTGGAAGTIRTTEATVAEAAGAYITICKRATHSSNTVIDLNSRKRLEWARYVQTGKVGPTSDGKLNWYDATKCYTLHPAAADLAMVAGNILRITGSDESSRYFAGQVLVNSGFASAVNNLPGLAVKSVSFTGGNTDIVVNSGNQTLIAEVAGGSRTIKIVCQSIWSYLSGINVALLGGYGDWGIPYDLELANLRDMEQPDAAPNATAFPSWPTSDYSWSSTTRPDEVTQVILVHFYSGKLYYTFKNSCYVVALVRGGN
jgi:hypothetical protein